MQSLIKTNGVSRVPRDRLESGDAVRDVGGGECPLDQYRTETAGVDALEHVEQPMQIDDLMVTPVANAAPRVPGVDDFPVNALAGDAIGVVPVGGRSTAEDGDHVLQRIRERDGQTLPVLEDVRPTKMQYLPVRLRPHEHRYVLSPHNSGSV